MFLLRSMGLTMDVQHSVLFLRAAFGAFHFDRAAFGAFHSGRAAFGTFYFGRAALLCSCHF